MNCFSCERNLSAYLDDELPMDERIELEGHLDGCDVCRVEFETHQSAWEVAHRTTAEAAPDGLWEGIESQLQQDLQTNDGIQELTLMVKGLAAEVQDLRRTFDGLRRDLADANPSDPAADAYGREPIDDIRIRANPFRTSEPREARLEQLRRSS